MELDHPGEVNLKDFEGAFLVVLDGVVLRLTEDLQRAQQMAFGQHGAALMVVRQAKMMSLNSAPQEN